MPLVAPSSGTRAATVSVPRSVATLAACWALLSGACGDDAPASDEAPAAPTESGALAPPPLAPAEDRTPPSFDGVRSVEVLGERTYRLTWEPGRDDTTRTPLLSYQVAHVEAAFGEPDASTRPIGASLPGETSLELELSSGAGRFYVRAVDQAGNTSAWGRGLAQTSTRPWLRLPDGAPPTEVHGCEPTVQGQAVCHGADGHAARWVRDRWEPLGVPPGATLRLAASDDELLLYSVQGHLYAFREDGSTESLPVEFDGSPALPFRQFVAGPTGLRYWIDATGVVWVSSTSSFRRMRRPLAIPGEDCARLRAMQFTTHAGLAICDNGAVHSVATARAGMRWLPLTADTPFELTRGIDAVVADSDARVIAFTDDEVRSVGVGGWSSLFDGDASPTRPARVGRPLPFGGRVLVPTADGLFELAEERLRPVDGALRDVAAAIAPGPLEAQDALTLVYRDGGVATLQRGRHTWRIPPPPNGFLLGRLDRTRGLWALATDGHAGVWRWLDAGWSHAVPSLPAAPPEASLHDLAGRDAPFWVVLAGGDAAGPALWESRGGAWTRASWVLPAPPPPPPRGWPEDTPPPIAPLTGIDPARAEAPLVPPDGPFLGVEITSDGRAIAHTRHQVWWRIDAGWMLVQTFDEPVHAATPDAGETWVAIVGERAVRCWRDDCGDAVPPPGFAPDDAVSLWPAPGGLLALLADGTVSQFVAEEAPPVESRVVPGPADLPAGGWVDVLESLPATTSGGVVQRISGASYDVLLKEDGTVWEQSAEGEFLRQGTLPDALLLVALPEGWAVLTSRGLLRLGVAPVATSDAP